MTHFFTAFMLVAVMLEMFELNIRRLSTLKHRTFSSIGLSLLVTTFIYAIFMIVGWYSALLMPAVGEKGLQLIVAGFVLMLITYAFVRRAGYNEAGHLVYSSLPLFSLIVIARSIMHIITGFCVSLMTGELGVFVLSYFWGVALFSVAVVLSKTGPFKIFGIPVGYIKMLSYALAILFIFI